MVFLLYIYKWCFSWDGLLQKRELGSRQGDIMTRILNSNHTWLSGIGSDAAIRCMV